MVKVFKFSDHDINDALDFLDEVPTEPAIMIKQTVVEAPTWWERVQMDLERVELVF